jgi:AP-2 complex subunit mu-1
MQATSANAWRKEGIVHAKNNIYIDVVETVNTIFSNKGTVLKTDVSGSINVKCQLSGMPECKFGMNDKLFLQRTNVNEKGVHLDDTKFHQCVKLNKFDKERAITFIPPDGSFVLMTYRISENIAIPFKIVTIFTETKNGGLEYRIKLKATYDKTYSAQNIEIVIPLPNNVDKKKTNVGVGKAKYESSKNGIVWRIKKFQGGSEALLRCDAKVNAKYKDKHWNKPPINMTFQLPMFTASGIQIRFLKVVEKEGYKPNKWIRYMTKSGEFLHRI